MERQRVVLAGRAPGAEEARPGRQFARLPSLPRHREHARAEAEQQQHAEQVEAAHRARSAPDSLRTSHSASTRSEEHTSELQSLMRISYAVFCLKTKIKQNQRRHTDNMIERN